MQNNKTKSGKASRIPFDSGGLFCYACTANGHDMATGAENSCWLDSNQAENCWIERQPSKKEDCPYWELVDIDV